MPLSPSAAKAGRWLRPPGPWTQRHAPSSTVGRRHASGTPSGTRGHGSRGRSSCRSSVTSFEWARGGRGRGCRAAARATSTPEAAGRTHPAILKSGEGSRVWCGGNGSVVVVLACLRRAASNDPRTAPSVLAPRLALCQRIFRAHPMHRLRAFAANGVMA
jgi:hypothetical protein